MKYKYISLILILSIILFGCDRTVSNNYDSQKIEPITIFLEDKTVKNFQFTNAIMTIEDGSSTLVTTITNTYDTDVEISYVLVHFYNGDQQITTLKTLVGGFVEAHNGRVLTLTTNEDLQLTDKITYEIIN